MPMRSAMIAGLFAAAAFGAFAAPRLVFRGELGQSALPDKPPVAWTGASWCVGDAQGTVYLPDAWRIRAGSRQPEKMKASVPGTLFGDGRDIYAWTAHDATVRRLKVVPDGLAPTSFSFRLDDWRYHLFFAPAGLTNGYARQGRLFGLHPGTKKVHAWDGAGRPLGSVFSCSGKVEKLHLVHAVGLHPETGDLLLGLYWPECRVRRFTPSGEEVTGGVWPISFMCEFFFPALDGLWLAGGSARSFSDTYARGPEWGWHSHAVKGVARTAGGWWVATTQGAQFFPEGAPRARAPECRVGGLARITALGLSDGFVLAASQYALYGLWLDDEPNEALSRDQNWTVGGKWSGRIVALETAADGAFVMAWEDGRTRETWRFDPRLTDIKDRKRRMLRIPEPPPRGPLNEAAMAGGFRAVAGGGEIALFKDGVKVFSLPSPAEVVAAQGDWLVVYNPQRFAIEKYKLLRF